jgi:hypothetical protein
MQSGGVAGQLLSLSPNPTPLCSPWLQTCPCQLGKLGVEPSSFLQLFALGGNFQQEATAHLAAPLAAGFQGYSQSQINRPVRVVSLIVRNSGPRDWPRHCGETNPREVALVGSFKRNGNIIGPASREDCLISQFETTTHASSQAQLCMG